MTDEHLTRRPATKSSVLSATAAIAAVLGVASASPESLGAGVAGTAVLIVGLSRGRRQLIDVGCLSVFVGVVVGALETGDVELTLVGTVAAVVAWDVGQAAVGIGEQLGREAETTRLEIVHAISSALVGSGTVAVAYAAYVLASDQQPVTALLLLLAAATLVTIGLGARRRSRSRSVGVGPR